MLSICICFECEDVWHMDMSGLCNFFLFHRRTKKGIIRKLKSRICGFFCMLSKHDGIRFY
nr:Hypothetical protein pB28_00113 [Escherichia coli O25b:H4-ST131]